MKLNNLTNSINELKSKTFPGENILITQTKLNNNILLGFYDLINKEKDLLLNEINLFLNEDIKNTNPLHIWKRLNNYILQMARLSLVYDPIYYRSESLNKAQGTKYDMVKIYWVNDDGKKFRAKTKTYGRVGCDGLNTALLKLFENEYFELKIIDADKKNGIIVNILNENLEFTYTDINKERFICTALRFEMWNMYCERYYKNI